jgi:chemotaxis protein MotA
MFYLSGLIVALGSILFSIVHLRQSASNYFDPVGLAVVVGGTFAVSIMILPWEMHREIHMAIKRLFGNQKIDLKAINLECFEMIRKLQEGNTSFRPTSPSIIGQTLTDGIELLGLGFSHEKIQLILEERLFQWNERKVKVANAFRSLAKYPPAFGLVGTVLGLVSLMRAISDGASSSEAGFRMAVALVATLYGLLTANLILNPAGENVLKSTTEERKAAELALEAVLLASKRVNLLEAQEMLNSHVAPEERINILGSFKDSETESEAAA